MKNLILPIIAILFASNALAASQSLVCTVSDGRIVTIEQLPKASKSEAPKYAVTIEKANKEATSPEQIYKLFYSHEGTGPLATVYINQSLVIFIPVAQPSDLPSGHQQGTLGVTGEGTELNVVCVEGITHIPPQSLRP